MCRSIKVLRQPVGTASDEEIRAAALQFVRKVSGFREPSRVNSEAFEAAVEEITLSSRRMLEQIAASTSERRGHRLSA